MLFKYLYIKNTFCVYPYISFSRMIRLSQLISALTLNTAILPWVIPSALNHTPCSLIRKERLSHGGQLCSHVQCCVCVWDGLWLSLSAGPDLWWWMRHVISPHSLVFHEQGSVHIPVPSGTALLHKHMLSMLARSLMGGISRSNTKRCVSRLLIVTDKLFPSGPLPTLAAQTKWRGNWKM